MTVTVYRSTDASAPTLYGAVSGLINVLDGCLVNGYGAKSAAGWSKAYSGTNLAAYRAPNGTRMYLYVDDSGTSNARVNGYESMSSISSGTRAFPNSTQVSGGLYWMKSTLTDTTARAWVLVADDRRFYFWANTAGAAAGSPWSTGLQMFGDFVSYRSNDLYNCRITGSVGSTMSFANCKSNGVIPTGFNNAGVTVSGQYNARNIYGLGDPQLAGFVVSGHVTGASGAGNMCAMGCQNDLNNAAPGTGGSAIVYPQITDNGMPLSRLYVPEVIEYGIHGYCPGIWAPSIGASVSLPVIGDTVSGTGDLAGKTFEFMTMTNGTNTAMRMLFETSNTW